MKVLIQAGKDAVGCMVHPINYILEPGKPLKVENDFDAGIILQEKTPYGVVEVNQVEDASGIHFDVEEAIARSQQKLDSEEHRFVDQWAADMVAQFAQQGKPVPAPFGRVKEIVERRGIDLKKEYGVEPVGQGANKLIEQKDKQIDELRSANANMQAQLTELLSKVNALAGRADDDAAKKKGK